MVRREYKSMRECAKLFVSDSFDCVPDYLVKNQKDFWDEYSFYGRLDECEQGEQGERFGLVDPPMWGTYFMPADHFVWQDIEDNRNVVMELGFTIIEDEDGLFALGIDGAGYDFYASHWIPLYKALGFQWHDEYACPECSDQFAEPPAYVRMEENSYGEYSCPKCGCWASSPEEDGLIKL